jgi:biotin carboxyl carrier protein
MSKVEDRGSPETPRADTPRTPAEPSRSYVALLDGGKREERMEVSEGERGVYAVRVNGKTRRVDALRLDHGTVSLIVDGQSYAVELEPSGESKLNVLVKDSLFTMEVLDEKRLRMRRASGRFSVEGKVTLVAPMPGKVVKILAKVGDTVKEGQGLIVVEAMKMENELKSPKSGKVTDIFVKEGQPVEGGAKLAAVE